MDQKKHQWMVEVILDLEVYACQNNLEGVAAHMRSAYEDLAEKIPKAEEKPSENVVAFPNLTHLQNLS